MSIRQASARSGARRTALVVKMTDRFDREIGLLRVVTQNLVSGPAPDTQITQEYLRVEDLALVRRQSSRLLAIRRAGYNAFTDLTEATIELIPGMRRGVHFANFQTALLEFLNATYFERPAASIGHNDASSLRDHFLTWFQDLAKPRRVYVPCVISPWAAPTFTVGPVEFVFIDEVRRSPFYAQIDSADVLARDAFHRLLETMKAGHANWLARVSVEGCEHKRAEEVGALAVDLALVALQLAAPGLDTRSMARLDARRGTNEQRTISEANGNFNEGWARRDPGISIGTGTLADILTKTRPLITAVGNRVTSFAVGRSRLPVLETAWCDSAYWLREALAEPLDSIAVAKLETALEVLLVSESSTRSKRRMLQILDAFYGLKPGDPINKNMAMTATQFAQTVARDRSRILHGTRSTLNAQLEMNRGGLETFATDVIRRAVLELEDFSSSPQPNEDGVDAFLAWVALRSPKGATA